jgi:hypothetical protein
LYFLKMSFLKDGSTVFVPRRAMDYSARDLSILACSSSLSAVRYSKWRLSRSFLSSTILETVQEVWLPRGIDT